MKQVLMVFACLFLILSACDQRNRINSPKNVILLIGDGTGLSQVSSAFYFKESLPNYSRFKHIGLINTSSSSHKITDSAAGATAFACGVKTYNGAIGVTKDSTGIQNLVELISPKKIKSGLVATSSIVHATPACFYAHAKSRSQLEDIAADLVESEIDFFAAGGKKFFNKRSDDQNLLNSLKEKHFMVDTTTLSDFTTIQSFEKVGYLLSEDAMPQLLEGRGGFLPQATELGIQFLNQDDSPFFMMIEGSQVDWGGHENNGEYLVSELIDFDDAIGKALDFAEQDGNTLVVVTADHETGGFALAPKTKQNADGKDYSDYNEIGLAFATGGHSTTLIPVFAYGPGSEQFSGIYQNNDIYHKIVKLTKWSSPEFNIRKKQKSGKRLSRS